MRIGISTSVADRGESGVGQYLLALIRALLPHADAHQFILFVLQQDFPLFEFAADKMQLLPVPEDSRSALKNIFWHQTRLPKLARELRLDVLHIPTYRRLLWSKPCRLVATIHDLAPFHLAGKYDWKRMFYGRVVARYLAKRQDHIIAVSKNTAQDLEHYFGLSRDRITVIYNGLDHERFHPGSRDAAKAFVSQHYGLTRPFFLYVARLEHPAKNHVRLINAFEQFKAVQERSRDYLSRRSDAEAGEGASSQSDWQLVFGGSDWHGAEAIHRSIQSSNARADIRCLGFVPDDALPDLYRAAAVFIYPSLYEGFGFPPLEAMACGCPVICSARGALGEVVGSAAVMADPEDIASIARKMIHLATDGKARQRLAAAGLSHVEKFDWERTAAETVGVYEKVALLNESVIPVGKPLLTTEKRR